VFSNYRLSDRECTLRAFCIRDAGVNVDCFFMYHRWRYIQIAKLSETLRRVSLGHYELEIRDNQEGELSILKSEL